MIRAALLILLLVVAFGVWKAPAGVLRQAVEQVQGMDLIDTRGTLWNGSGTILIDQAPLGTLDWQIQPKELLTLTLAYDIRLASQDVDLTGELNGTATGFATSLSGFITNAAVNRLLSTYQITMTGDVQVESLDLSASYERRVEHLDGTLRWQGGDIQYPETNSLQLAVLPPLIAILKSQNGEATATVLPEDSSTPLLQARLLDNGRYRIGITKLLTKLAGRPWRGSDPDHAIVLELEEQLL